jgi:hypothetical protein
VNAGPALSAQKGPYQVTKRILTSTAETVNYLDAANEANRRLIIEAMARKGGQAGTLQERIHRLFLSNRPGTVGELVQVGPGSWIVAEDE